MSREIWVIEGTDGEPICWALRGKDGAYDLKPGERVVRYVPASVALGEWECERCGCSEPEEVTGSWRCSKCRWSEPECTCYEMTGGHQSMCPLSKRAP